MTEQKDRTMYKYPWEESDEVPIAFIIGTNKWEDDDLIKLSHDFPDDFDPYYFEGNIDLPWNKVLDFTEDNWSKLERKDISFISGRGKPECPGITVWTENYIFFVVQHDTGSTRWESIPRNPIDYTVTMP